MITAGRSEDGMAGNSSRSTTERGRRPSCRPPELEMRQRRQADIHHVRVALAVENRVEQHRGTPAQGLADQHVMQHRVHARGQSSCIKRGVEHRAGTDTVGPPPGLPLAAGQPATSGGKIEPMQEGRPLEPGRFVEGLQELALEIGPRPQAQLPAQVQVMPKRIGGPGQGYLGSIKNLSSKSPNSRGPEKSAGRNSAAPVISRCAGG